MPANRRFRAHGPDACVPGIVRRYRGLRQGTDNERFLAPGGSACSRVAVESASASTVREPDSCCSSRRRPGQLTGLPIEGAAQLLLVHRSSSDERADSAAAQRFSFAQIGSDLLCRARTRCRRRSRAGDWGARLRRFLQARCWHAGRLDDSCPDRISCQQGDAGARSASDA
jgi:hypothetical protein